VDASGIIPVVPLELTHSEPVLQFPLATLRPKLCAALESGSANKIRTTVQAPVNKRLKMHFFNMEASFIKTGKWVKLRILNLFYKYERQEREDDHRFGLNYQ
jgi:hypothetical protein